MIEKPEGYIIGYTDKAMGACADVIKEAGRLGISFEILDGRKVSIPEKMESIFRESAYIIFVSASGIAVRMIAPYVKSKDKDPGVLVIDEKKTFVISLLSGHIGGANELAESFAKALGAIPVITTATDVNGKFAADMWAKKAGCAIEDISMIKYVSGAVLKGERVYFKSDFETEGSLPAELTAGNSGYAGICVTLSAKAAPFDKTLKAVPRIVTVGAGCRKNTDPDEFVRFMEEILEREDISVKAVEKIASIDIKKDEPCMKKLSEKLEASFVTYTAEELEGAGNSDGRGAVFEESCFVKKTTGTGNVCERSAYLGSERGRIILKKESRDGMTVSLGMRDFKCIF